MANRALASAAKAAVKKSPLDLAEEQHGAAVVAPAVASPPIMPAVRPPVALADTPLGTRATERLSISLLPAERVTLEDRARKLQGAGHREIKTSRLARVAFKLLEQTSDENVLRLAGDVPDLEQLRARRR